MILSSRPAWARVMWLVALCAPLQVSAQSVGAIRGNVTGNDGAPIMLATITMMGTKVVAHSDSAGRFFIPRVNAGTGVLHITLAGYRPALTAVQVAAGDTAQVQVMLAGAAFVLAPLEVEGKAVPMLPAMRGFEERRARASGHFFNRQEISRMQARRFTDVLRRVPGVQLFPVRGPFETGEAVRMARTIGVTGTRACPVLYYINGSPFPVTGDIPIDHYISPDDIAALEVYHGMSQIPAEFNSASHNARCGVIVIWTLSAIDTTEAR